MAFRIIQPNYISGGGGGGSTLLTGLVSWWDLTANGNDSHGSNNLSSRGSPSFGTVDGYACVTTDSSNHLYNASPTGLGLDTFTIAAWLRQVATPAGSLAVVMMNATTSASTRYGLRASGDDLLLTVGDGASTQTLTDLNVLTDSTWKLAIATYESSGGTYNLYTDDGTETASGSSGYTTLNSASLGIGIGGDGDGDGNGGEFNGAIKSAAIWSRALTSDERTELWNSGVPLVYADL